MALVSLLDLGFGKLVFEVFTRTASSHRPGRSGAPVRPPPDLTTNNRVTEQHVSEQYDPAEAGDTATTEATPEVEPRRPPRWPTTPPPEAAAEADAETDETAEAADEAPAADARR